MSEINTDRLVQDIEVAFLNLPYPGDDNLVYDNSDKYDDVVETKANFRGKHWKEVSSDTIKFHRDCLSFFTPQAFGFYLPAFLIASVLERTKMDTLPENLIARLTPDNPFPEINADFKDIVRMLTPPQKHVIADFLKWYINNTREEVRVFMPNLKKATEFWID